MAATVVLYEYTGASAASTTSSDRFAGTIRLRANDEGSETNVSSNPVVRSGVTVYSMERWLRMRATAGINVSLTNPKFYSTGTAWDTDKTIPYARTAAAGATPVTPASTAGFTAMHTYLTGARLGLGTYTVTTTPNFIGDFLVLMCSVSTTATTGTIGSETWTWAYDEA